MSFAANRRVGRFKAETGEIDPLLDVTGEHFELRAGSGLEAKNPIDVGVHDGAKNGVDLEKAPKMAGDVPVRYVLDGTGPAPAFSPTCSLSYSRAVCCVDTDVDADSRLDVLSRLFTHILSSVVCDRASVSSWVIGFRVISFTSHGFGLIWAAGIFGSATGECGPSGQRKRPPIGGRTDAAPFRLSIFHLPLCVLGGVHEFGSCNETGKLLVSKLKQAQIGRKCAPNLLTLG
ncbi:MAG: hypothetical protein OXI91_16635 [Chloroflexota bacterium]|nr:hypothetical protein [Chloroflexota bacterium]